MATDLFTEIKVKYNTLSKNQKTIANYILENRDKCVRMTLSGLGKECNLSETTIIRFINKLEYTSYQDFRLDMVQALAGGHGENTGTYKEIKCGDTIEEIKLKTIAIAAGAINDIENLLPSEKIEKAVSLIEKAGKIMFFGAGGSGVIAADVYHKFLRSGRSVVNENNSHIALIHASQLSKGDLLVLISHEGESKEVLECCRLAQRGGATVMGVTSYMHSDLAEMADFCIFSSTNDSPYYNEAMVSRLVQLVIMDTLFIAVATRDDDKGMKAFEAAKMATREMKVHNTEEE